MNIIKLSSENVKRLQAVEITPQGNMVVIGGKNGAGKSSVLDSIQYALGGEPSDRMPVRRGEDKATIVVDLGEIVVKRTFTAAGGGSLIVTNADGQKQLSPQSILDKLTGKLTFDPLAFSREKPKQQAEILRGLVGLDFTKSEAERQKAFDERTAVNREVKALESRIQAMPKHEGAPDKEVSTADILAEQERAAKTNAAFEHKRRTATDMDGAAKRAGAKVELIGGDIAGIKKAILELQQRLTTAEAALKEANINLSNATEIANRARGEAEGLIDIDLSPFKAKAAEAEANNRKVRENAQRASAVALYKTKIAEADKLTAKIEKLDSDRRKAVSEAKYPIPGLMFDTAGGVTLNGIPFEQCSAAEQLKVSVAIGLALNPKLRVLLIRDGSLLDDDSMKVLAEMADQAKAQIWLERVGESDKTAVIIEDGRLQLQLDGKANA